MDVVLAIAVVIYLALEIFMLRRLYLEEKRLCFKRVRSDFISASLLLAIIFVFKIGIPHLVLLFYLIAVLLNAFFGYYLDFFNRSRHFDRYLHSYGIFSFSLLLYFFLTDFVQSGGSKIFRALFIVFLGIALGAIFEILEFLSDAKQKEARTRRSARQKGLRDTDLDQIFNGLGSLCGAVFAYFFYL